MNERFNGLKQVTPCQVVESARNLAAKKGFDSKVVFCPFLYRCNGNDCVFRMADVKPGILQTKRGDIYERKNS